ncbi:MAG: O-antigen ligase family protein [Cetobacterium sp.]
MKIKNYSSFMLGIMIFYSILPLIYKIFPYKLITPEYIYICLAFPILFLINKVNKKSYYIILGYSVFLLINILLNLEYEKSIKEILIRVIPFGLFPIIVAGLPININTLNKSLYILNNINFSLLIYISLINKKLYLNKELMNYMTFGYWLLPTVLFYMYFYLIMNKKRYLYLNIISIVIMFFYGSRFSTLLAIVGSYILYSFRLRLIKKIFITIILSIIFILVYLNFKDILLILIDLLEKNNFSTLSLKRLLFSINGDAKTILTGREQLYTETLKMILNNPFGSGIFGFKNNIFFNKQTIYYPHNIILELLQHFGIFILFILLFLLKYIYIHMKKFKNKKLLIILIILNLKLLVTGSYLWEPFFWIFLSMISKNYNRRVE